MYYVACVVRLEPCTGRLRSRYPYVAWNPYAALLAQVGGVEGPGGAVVGQDGGGGRA